MSIWCLEKSHWPTRETLDCPEVVAAALLHGLREDVEARVVVHSRLRHISTVVLAAQRTNRSGVSATATDGVVVAFHGVTEVAAGRPYASAGSDLATMCARAMLRLAWVAWEEDSAARPFRPAAG